MRKKIKAIAVAIIVTLTACKKNSNENVSIPTVQSAHELSLKTAVSDPAANPENPYDFIGYYHNIGLDSLRHYVKSTHDTTRSGKNTYLQHYFKNNFGADIKVVYHPEEKIACTDYKAVWFSQNISVDAMGYWKSLSGALEGIKDLDHYHAYKQRVVLIESSIITSKLPADEKKNLLITASILRYSGYYWMNAFSNGGVTFHSPTGMAMPDSFLRKIAGVIVGIGADASVVAAGYMSGYYSLLADAELWSEICGYYTGWW